MKSTILSQQQFTKIEGPNIQRSTFDRGHGYKTTLDAGVLYPVFIDEALPGDTFNVRATMFGRLATPLKPIMDNMQFDLHFFSVPNRLVWENWERFNGQQDDPSDTTNFLIPQMQAPEETGYAEGSIFDYAGLPTKVPDFEHSALPFRAMNLIYNEWYRDQNLQNSLQVPKGDGPDNPSLYDLQSRNKRKDYFTSALPWAQKGEEVSVPLGSTAPVYGPELNAANPHGMMWQGNDFSLDPDDVWPTRLKFINSDLDDKDAVRVADFTLDSLSKQYDNLSIGTKQQHSIAAQPAYADLSEATASTINALREAFQIQKMYERDARGGTRYTELIKAHFGISSPDARLQRPEYLGGGSTSVNMSPVAQTSGTEDGSTPQGNLSAIGTFNVNQNGFTKSFTEHEIVIGFVSVRADLNYQQGLHRMWSRQTRFDFYWPSFANLGEQAILNKEIYTQGTDEDDDVFGYQERFAEYRYKPSLITGKYRSNADQSLDLWHLAQDFEALPALNSSFIKEDPPIERIVAVPSEPQFLLDCYFDFKATRPMPTFATPGLIDHF